MPQKTSEEKIELMQKYYKRGLTPTEIAIQVNVNYTTAYIYTRGKERLFKSSKEYKEYLAQKNGYKSYSEYIVFLAKKRGFKTQHEYQQHLAKERGFKSEYEYRQYLTKKKQKRLENIELSNLIKRNLKKLGKEQNWLAEKLGVTKGTVSKYASGTYIPNYERLQKLFKVLKLPYKTIDDILE